MPACCGLLARGRSGSSGEGGHFAANASTVLGTHEGLLKGPTLLAYRGTGSCSLYLWVAAAAQATALHANATTRSLLIGPSRSPPAIRDHRRAMPTASRCLSATVPCYSLSTNR